MLGRSGVNSERTSYPEQPGRNSVTDEVLRRVGRNLVIYQQIEHVLKYLTSKARLQAPAARLVEQFQKQVTLAERKTMGALAGQLSSDVLRSGPEEEMPDAVDEVWMGFQFSMNAGAETAARYERDLKEVVDRRNELVHGFLPRWEAAAQGDAEEVLAWLDAQRASSVAMLDELHGWARTLDAAIQDQVSIWASGEGQRQLELLYIRSSRLVVMLGQASLATRRMDGWMLLSTAGGLIKRQAPEELEDLKSRFGVSNLQAVLAASECFDIAQESVPGGGVRTIYRVSPGWRLTG